MALCTIFSFFMVNINFAKIWPQKTLRKQGENNVWGLSWGRNKKCWPEYSPLPPFPWDKTKKKKNLRIYKKKWPKFQKIKNLALICFAYSSGSKFWWKYLFSVEILKLSCFLRAVFPQFRQFLPDFARKLRVGPDFATSVLGNEKRFFNSVKRFWSHFQE